MGGRFQAELVCLRIYIFLKISNQVKSDIMNLYINNLTELAINNSCLNLDYVRSASLINPSGDIGVGEIVREASSPSIPAVTGVTCHAASQVLRVGINSLLVQRKHDLPEFPSPSSASFLQQPPNRASNLKWMCRGETR